jgi:hypothetical protein
MSISEYLARRRLECEETQRLQQARNDPARAIDCLKGKSGAD